MSGISRVTTFSQQTQQLLNLLKNEQTLNDVMLQQSSGLKAPTYAGVAPQAGQLLNVTALQTQAQGFLDNISSAQTRLNLTDTTLASISKLATNFQTELQQLQSSPTPPNISDLARTSLQQLGSLLDSSDGTQFLFAGGQQNAPPVTTINTTRIPTKTLTLSGNLDTTGTAPVNGNVAPPTIGSFVDASLTGQNAVFDSNGHQYDTTVRFVHESATKWQAYVVGMVRTDDNTKSATVNGQPISGNNPVAIGAPFNPAAAAPQFNGINNPSAPANLLSFGTAGVPPIALPTGGGAITVNVDANAITNTAGASAFSQIDNATPTSQVVLNKLNLDPTTPVGDTTSITLSGPTALFGTGATGGTDKFNATVTLTKTQLANPSLVPPQSELWQASITSLTDASTGAAVTIPAITAAAPYVIGTFPPGQIPFTHNVAGTPFSIQIAANAGPATPDATGATFRMAAVGNGSLTVGVRAGTVTTNPTGTTVPQFTINPQPPGSPQFLELSANLSSAMPLNISVATPTAGSFADLGFTNSQALVDSNGNAHNLTLRFVKTSTGPDLYQAYAIGLTSVESGKDSTNPPISPTNPIAIGPVFNPASAATLALTLPAGQLTFSPPLVNGASMTVNMPITATTFTTANSTIVLNNAENTTTASSTSPSGQLNFNGNLSTAAVGIPSAAPAGALTALNIAKAGTGYAVGDTITFNTPTGGVAAVVTVGSIGPGGTITGASVTTAGSGYTATPTIASTSGGGTGAVVNIPLVGPAAADLTNPIGALAQPATTLIPATTNGAGYNATTTIVTFPPPPNGGVTATAKATVVAGVVTQIKITDPGSGYLTTPTPTITDTSGAGSGATVAAANFSLLPENPNNTADLHLFGTTAVRDSNGHAYDATVRLQYSTKGLTTGWRATLVSLTDPATGQTPAGVAVPVAIGAPPFDVFNSQDAAHGAITIPANGPQVVNLPGGATMALTIPINSENFSGTSAATNLAVGGAPTASLSANIADTTYFKPGNKVFDTSQGQLQFRTAADSVVSFGVRADDPAFEQLYRVLNFFKDQSVPASPTEVGNASQLINNAITGINGLRADVANTQAVLKQEQTYQTTTLSLAKNTSASIITADSATTAMNLNAISNLLQESFATLGVVKGLSLVNYIK